ncbi:hypothetical protein ACI8AF_13165 [Blastococcus sp. SYSU D00669]
MTPPTLARPRPLRHPRSRATGPLRAVRDVVVGGAEVLAVLVAAPLLRRRYNRWGATAAEVAAPLPGDELVPAPRLGYTRAVTVAAPVEDVWPWLVQIGQGRGGLYSFDGLENLVGCDLHSAGRIHPDLQRLRVGDVIRLAPADGAPFFRVEHIEAPTTLVLLGGGPQPDGPPDGDPHITWQWVLHAVDGGRRTRLVVRQRLAFPPAQRLLWHVVEPVTFVMERRMLRGLARRAEGRSR